MKLSRRTFLKALSLAPAAVAAPGLTLASPSSRSIPASAPVGAKDTPGARRSTITNFRKEAREQLAIWMQEKLDDKIYRALL